MDWGQWLFDSRTECGVSMNELAELSGLANSQIHAIEKNQSSPTLNAIVRLCFGMGISLTDLFRTLGITYTALDFLNTPDQTTPHLTITDIQNFLSVRKKFGGQFTKEFMYASFYRIIQFAPPKYQAMKEFQAAYDIIGDVIKVQSEQRFTPLQYPHITTSRYYEILLADQGVITIRDFGSFLRALRLDNEYSLRELAEKLGTSHSTIARLEQGIVGKTKFDDILMLDSIFDKLGTLICIGWFAEEFHTGIASARYIQDEALHPPKTPSSTIGWQWTEFVFSETLITISRWYARYNLEQKWLIKGMREYLNQIESGRIKPSSTFRSDPGDSSDLSSSRLIKSPAQNILDGVFNYSFGR